MEPRVELIGPNEAMDILSRNTRNRILRPRWIEELTRRMRRGEWRLSSVTIAIGEDGTLYNGQHRLLAVIASETRQEFLVARGCNEDDPVYVDGGKPRTLRDALMISGLPCPTQPRKIAVVRAFYSLPWGKLNEWSPVVFTAAAEACSNSVELAFSATRADNKDNAKVVVASTIAAVARAHAAGVDEVTLRGFCRTFTTGEPSGVRTLVVDSGVRKVRDNLLRPTKISGSHKQSVDFISVSAQVEAFAACKVRPRREDPYPLRGRYLDVLNDHGCRVSAVPGAKARS